MLFEIVFDDTVVLSPVTLAVRVLLATGPLLPLRYMPLPQPVTRLFSTVTPESRQ